MALGKNALRLYAVTDRSWLGERTLARDVEAALRGGVTLLQFREKTLCEDDFLSEALEMRALCTKYGVPLIINDSVEVALKSGADGVHIGQSDADARAVRARIGDKRILGVSVQTVEQALLAEESGADYLGVGAVFPTATKTDADFVPYDTLRAICAAVKIPVLAIGGISAHNIEKLLGSGICGVAVVSAIFAEGDITAAAEGLRALADNIFG